MARDFHSTEHLSPEAVAAFVDCELPESAVVRAAQHMAQCQECFDEVEAQRGASERLCKANAGEDMHAPQELVERLAQLCPEDFPGDTIDEHTDSRMFDRLEAALRTLKPRG